MKELFEDQLEAKKLMDIRENRAGVLAKITTANRSKRTKAEVELLLDAAVERAFAKSDPMPRLHTFGTRSEQKQVFELPEFGFGTLVVLLGGVDRVVEALLANMQFDSALSTEDHAAQLDRLHKQRIELEWAEEAEVLRLENDGWLVFRRPDVDGKLLLEVWAKTLPENAPRPARVTAPKVSRKGVNDGANSVHAPVFD